MIPACAVKIKSGKARKRLNAAVSGQTITLYGLVGKTFLAHDKQYAG